MRIVNLGARLPNGKIRVHWFVRDSKGPIKTGIRAVATMRGPLQFGGAVGYIACQPQRQSVQPQVQGMTTRLFMHSDDVRAVSCPECLATEAAKVALAAEKQESSLRAETTAGASPTEAPNER